MDSFAQTIQNSAGSEFPNLVKTLISIFRRAQSSPPGHKHRSLKINAQGFQNKVSQYSGALDILKLGGFEDRGETYESKQPQGASSYVLTWLESLDTSRSSSSSSNANSTTSSTSLASSSTSSTSSTLPSSSISSSSSTVNQDTQQPPGKIMFSNAVQRLRAGAFDEDSRNAIVFLMKVIRKAALSPPGHKRRTMRLNNEILQWRLGRLAGGLDILAAIGFVGQDDGISITLVHPHTVNHSDIVQCYNELNRHAQDLGIPRNEVPQMISIMDLDRVFSSTSSISSSSSSSTMSSSSFSFPGSKSNHNPSPPVSTFNPFQVSINRVEPQPRGSAISETEQQVEKLKQKRNMILKAHGSAKPLTDSERNVHIIEPGTPFNRRRPQTTTTSNSKRSSSHLSEQQLIGLVAKQRMAKAKQKERMTTKAMRDLEAMKKEKLYAETLLRLQFPSRLIVEGIFRPQETIETVCNVLKRIVLSEACQNSTFYLFTSPPKTILDSKKTLAQVGCCPAALIYIGWSNGTAPVSKDQLCRESMKGSGGSGSGNGSKVANMHPQDFSGEASSSFSSSSSTKTNSSSNGGNGKKTKKKGKGAPSWLKL